MLKHEQISLRLRGTLSHNMGDQIDSGLWRDLIDFFLRSYKNPGTFPIVDMFSFQLMVQPYEET